MQEDFLQRSRILIGEEGIKKLKKSSVIILGLGGVGSYACEALVRAGIGELSIVDHDRVEKSNINRQLIALHSNLGQKKVDISEARARDINPEIVLHKYDLEYNLESHAKIFAEEKNYDYVLDAIDDIENKINLLLFCLREKQAVISSMGMAKRLQAQRIKVDDISRTHSCPMAKKIRKALAKAGYNSGLSVVYSQEVPLKVSELGSISFVPSVAGLLMAAELVSHILNT